MIGRIRKRFGLRKEVVSFVRWSLLASLERYVLFRASTGGISLCYQWLHPSWEC